MPAKIIVTAGGTREPLDRVRSITNSSTGRMGAALVDAFAERGFDVLWIHGPGSERPRAACVERPVDTVASVETALKAACADPSVVAVVHAMAVSDYRPVRPLTARDLLLYIAGAVDEADIERRLARLAEEAPPLPGKLPSDKPWLPLLVPTIKLLDHLRSWAANPRLVLVSFKLTVGQTEARLLEIAQKQLNRTMSDLVVANDLEMFEGREHLAWLVDRNHAEGPVTGRANIADRVAARVGHLLERGTDPEEQGLRE
ncbi:MAG TPA: phosphopantothenoylcysteine decarboxylase [Candidatus Ozemobacteraceae bacterium]|nr:phosphopantothenoylcysteine decarboxylase [Candidatus Ozemobacteraceae bacterium]